MHGLENLLLNGITVQKLVSHTTKMRGDSVVVVTVEDSISYVTPA